jgi:hypothetical protein
MKTTMLALSLLTISLAPTVVSAEGTASSRPGSSAGPVAAGAESAAAGSVRVFDAALGRERVVPAAQAAEIVAAYWTPERRARAIPVVAKTAAVAPKRRAAEAEAAPKRIADPVSAKGRSGTAAEVVNFTNAVGKVFYRDPVDGRDYQCSGSTVNSGKRRLVFTAGHCVHGGPGRQWMTNWAFQPGYQRGTGTPGVFPYYQLWAQSGWFASGDRHYDYGIGITWNNAAGSRVVDAVGGNGLIVNPGRPFVTAIGYPSNFLGGETQSYCQVTLRRRSLFNSDQELNCWRGPGASGEPWLKDYNNANGLGWIVSDNSYRIRDAAPVYGPYFDGDTLALYNAAENASPF